MFRCMLGLIALSGCQLVFSLDSPPPPDGPGDDAPTPDADPCAEGHDEDNDSKIDACDNCPTEANADQALDGDGDPVGAQCDPFASEMDQIGFYRAFVEGDLQQVMLKPGAMLDGSLDGAAILSGDGDGEVSSLAEVASPKAIRVQFEVLDATSSQAFQLHLGTAGAFCGITLAGPGIGCVSGVCLRVDADSDPLAGEVKAELSTGFGQTTDIELRQDGTDIRCTVNGQSVAVAGTLSSDFVRVSTTGDSRFRLKSLIVYSGQ